jgi:hypothetical protein
MVMGMNGQTATSTDNQGQWHLTALACGQTQVIATRPGFIQGSLGQPRPGTAFRPIVLTADAPLHDAKISLAPQAVITGKVLDEQGDPMMNVTVVAMAARVIEGRRSFQAQGSVNTNDLGEYRISGLSAGKYIVCAQATGFNMNMTGSRVEERCYPGPVESGAASAFDMAGSTARVDFTLARVPAVNIHGTLSGAGGRGVTVSLQKRLSGMINRVGTPANMSPDGKFEIRGVTPGSYMLSADYWDSGKRLVARVPVEVGGADLDGVNVRLEAGFSVTGPVRIESRKPAASDVRQINLFLKSADPMTGGGQMIWGKERDAFTINELTSGSYRLECPPNSPLYLKRATLGGRDISREEIPITQSAGPIDVVLSDDTGSLEGQAEDPDGKPVPSWVMVLPAGDQAARQPRNAMTGADGHFTVPSLAPGKYQVFAWDDAQQVEYANPDWMQRNSAPVSVSVEGGQTAQAIRVRQKSALAQ